MGQPTHGTNPRMVARIGLLDNVPPNQCLGCLFCEYPDPVEGARDIEVKKLSSQLGLGRQRDAELS